MNTMGRPAPHRYILRVATLAVGDSATELWVGLITDEPLPPEELGDLIPADGMSAAELSVVRTWVTVDPRGG